MSPKILCALLQYFENAPLIGQGCASLRQVSPIGRIVSQVLVGGLHHLYVAHTRFAIAAGFPDRIIACALIARALSS
jgi:hypothetical protein